MKVSNLGEYDLYLFHQGTNYHAYEMLGAHFVEQDGKKGVRFAVWAPHAKSISVVGDFNGWDTRVHAMMRCDDGEVWSTFIEGLKPGDLYKYAIEPEWGGPHIMKADPYGFYAEKKPETASRLYEMSNYKWSDDEWMERKLRQPSYSRPMLTYEVHAGSWRRNADGEYLTYRELADQLISYVKDMNYTHIEFMPLCEHPFDGSWGYQTTGYYAVTSRYGDPDDFRYFVETAHKNGIGIIMDWVPGHFCKDNQGLREFDGKTLYESDNPQLSDNKGWGTINFDYGRTEVQSFLISNALFWFEEYHIDGLRIDGVANMLYLNFGREEGEWTPNKYGDTGNLEAMDFLKKLNETIFKYNPQALMIAEESTAWPLISKPVYMGGMGFNYKWNMGWMNDMLKYVSLDPVYRKWNHDKVTFSFMYAFSENFVLPLSHDEVVHGKCSLLSKMPGAPDQWRQFAGLRTFFAYWMAHPGKKLLFMGGEFGQYIEWKYDDSLDWHLPQQYPMHRKMLEYSRALNKFYCDHKAFWEVDFDWNGFQWIDCNDNENSIVSFMRKADKEDDYVIVICNFTPEVHKGYRVGVPEKGVYREVFNSDLAIYGGSDVKNEGDITSVDVSWHNREQSVLLTIPPLATIYLRRKDAAEADEQKALAEGAAKPKKTAAKTKAKTAAAPKKAAGKTTAGKTAAKKTAAKKTAAEEKPKARTKKAETETAEKPKRAAATKKTAAAAAEKKTTAAKKPAAKKTVKKAAASPAKEEAPKKRRTTKKTES